MKTITREDGKLKVNVNGNTFAKEILRVYVPDNSWAIEFADGSIAVCSGNVLVSQEKK